MASSSKNDDLGALRMNSEQTALKDEVYYWLDNARFLVSACFSLRLICRNGLL
jgi:hypothetical protein